MADPAAPARTRTQARPSAAALRRELVEMVERDLLGPAGGPEETLTRERPGDRYLVGMVAPSGLDARPETEEGLQTADDDREDAPAQAEAAQRSLFPSSIGMSFRVAGDCPALVVSAGWGRYDRVKDPETDRLVWRRIPCSGELRLPLGAPRAAGPIGAPVPGQPEVRVDGVVRQAGEEWSVTLFLRNGQREPNERRDTAWLFQAELAVRAEDGSAAFLARARTGDAHDAEHQRLALAYRRRAEHAVGHGVAVQADLDEGDPTRARALRTRVMPGHEVAQMRPPTGEQEPMLAGLELDMTRLGDAPDGELAALLTPLVGAYEDWTRRQRQRLDAGGQGLADHAEAAEQALADAERARGRILAGIELVCGDPIAREAFRFANRAMALQRVRSQWAEHRRRGGTDPLEAFDVPARRSWYPFQLAFVLLNLPSITDPTHPDRSHPTAAVCDLLWFPTGGGKTEAYLGLAAYVMGLRRMQGPLGGRRADAGVAVLMRYTLRVLTLQQFQRAAALVCACESLRRDDPGRLGAEPFLIGLWVGQNTAPNSLPQAEEALRNLKGDGWSRTGGGRPDQLAHCPWCGLAISPGRDMTAESFERGRARVVSYCSDAAGGCEFSALRSPGEGLPVITVDEEIYRRLPSILVGTVDKFAQLPWNGDTQTLFGTVSGRCTRHGFRSPGLQDSDTHPAKGTLPAAKTVDRDVLLRPPDLVIQDELHLISGPLGTMVGLYETAVDRLMSWEIDGVAVRPKVVASTATVRRAADQVHALFLRGVQVFPPQGLDVSDSFFAREVPVSEEAYGRLYLGVCAPGRRLKAVAIRTYVALLAAAQTLYVRHGAAADPWMTLVGYFNAMQELAGMRRLCEDDVRTRLQRVDQRGFANRTIGAFSIEELTSRLSAADIPRRLDEMERGFDPADDARRRSSRKGGPRPLDVLLATNMISVGVDVRRLGLMVVAGQPKTTAEYIQATSRVGRQTPGLVMTVYNWARPRDLSHYERFEHYHDTFYQHVEALSVTPFAPRARDRGLSAILVALYRLASLAANPNRAAQSLAREAAECRDAIEAIVHRAAEVSAESAVADAVRAGLEHRVDTWLDRAAKCLATGAHLGYRAARDGQTIGLLERPGTDGWRTFTALSSLRDVEPTVGLVMRDEALYPGDEL